MIKNSILFVFTFSIFSNSYCQQKVFEAEKIFQDPALKSNSTMAFSNQLNDDLLLLTLGNTLTQAILLDKNYTLLTKIPSQSLPLKYDNLIGHDIDEQGNYTLLFGFPFHKKFSAIWINPNEKYCISKKIPFAPKKQRLLTSFTHKNRLHILTIRKDSSKISLYMLEKDNFVFKKSFSFNEAEYKSYKSNGFNRSLHDQLKDHADEFLGINLMKVSNKNPNSLEITSRPFKFYQKEDKIVITLDNRISKTKVFQIDLKTLDLEYHLFDSSQNFPDATKSSSYIFQNQVFQVVLDPKSMYILVYDMTNKKLIKQVTLGSLTKNRELVEEVEFDLSQKKITSKPLEKPNQFFQKISKRRGYPGISIYKKNEHFYLMAGSIKVAENQTNSAQLTSALIGGLVGALAYELAVSSVPTYQLSYNTDFYAYSTYNFTNSIYLNILLDSDLNPISQDRKPNDFDQLKKFENTLKKNKRAVNIFRHSNGLLHYNYVDKHSGKLRLYNFKQLNEDE